MKICYYNWVDFDDELNRGGGVTVYQRNIMSQNSDCYFISSGCYYHPPFNKVFSKIDGKKARIYNSPVLAPAHLSYGSKEQMENNELEECFIDLVNKYNGFDIIHFNNLEGVTINLLFRLKMKFPSMKIVVSIHNYYPFCSQVNLWYQEKNNCIDFHNGKSCLNCVRSKHSYSAVKKAYFLGDTLRALNIKDNSLLFKTIWSFAMLLNFCMKKFRTHSYTIQDITKLDTSEEGRVFENRRNRFIEVFNKYVDGVITVSERVKEICIQFGVKPELCKTLYIGTQHYKYWNMPYWINKDNTDKVFTIAYLGYMRRDKGFPFFLEALESLDNSLSKEIKLVVAAKRDDVFFDKLLNVAERFYSLEYYDGYNHNTIDSILDDVSLGIVPPLWEDNLPQVAIEMHCRRIPILTSSTGGAQELHNCNQQFTFISGDINSFKSKLEELIKQGINKSDYFANAKQPLSMETHLVELNDYYTKL